MSEYKRFIAYFYEYINGEKQKNAGFAKVELRNGMWRILFRLTIAEPLEAPIQVFGFAREGGYLLGIPLGAMNPDCNAPEEWAWRADTPIGKENYYFEQMNGIRIASGDGREFFTVWDDEPMNPGRFVMELPGETKQPELAEAEKLEESGQSGAVEQTELPGKTEESGQSGEAEQTELPGQSEESGQPREVEQTELPGKTEESELPEETEQAELPGQPERPLEIEPQPEQSPEIEPLREPEIEPLREPEQPSEIEPLREPEQNPAERLLQSRQRFRPFRDDEFTKCVQIKLCDILPLQQENWKVGRSNFLQHGYYLYRHLLLGRTKDGSYILGVPGTRNQQEEYMAQVFGYEHFKMAASSGCGRRFGYWYRIVEAPERSAEAGIQLMQDYHKMKEKDAMA